jgi:hypothetical protein
MGGTLAAGHTEKEDPGGHACPPRPPSDGGPRLGP